MLRSRLREILSALQCHQATPSGAAMVPDERVVADPHVVPDDGVPFPREGVHRRHRALPPVAEDRKRAGGEPGHGRGRS